MLKVFIPKEIQEGENRVAAVPETVKKMVKSGLEVFLESGAGTQAGFLDADFTNVGATVDTDRQKLYSQANLILKVTAPFPEEIKSISENATLISFLSPHLELDKIRLLRDRKVNTFSMNLIPRTTLAQKMDALSSQSNIAGYKSVILAAEALGKIFPMLMTAAGTLNPARVVIMGAGVAGLQAIATAKRLGAIVEAS
ncbi:MAG: NAD(P)(+) transhydrogenase (Re/Si-specific) subunit alpha, partial [Planctomycetota bacterium]